MVENRNLNSNSGPSISLDDPDRFMLTKTQLSPTQFMLVLSYQFNHRRFLGQLLDLREQNWVLVDSLNPFVYFSMFIDLNQLEFHEIGEMVTKISNGQVVGLWNILESFNMVDWSQPLLDSFQSLMRFSCVYQPRVDSAKWAKSSIMTLLGNLSVAGPSSFDLLFPALKPDLTVAPLTHFLQSNFSDLLHDFSSLLPHNSSSESISTAVGNALAELGRVLSDDKALLASFSDNKSIKANFEVSQSLVSKFNQLVKPLFKGNLVFFVQIFVRLLRREFPRDGGHFLAVTLLHLEKVCGALKLDRATTLTRLASEMALMLVSTQLKSWDSAAPKTRFTHEFKKIIKTMFETILDRMDGFGLSGRAKHHLQNYIKFKFMSLRRIFYGTRPGVILMLYQLQEEILRAMQVFNTSPLFEKLGLKESHETITKKLFRTAHLLGFPSFLYPEMRRNELEFLKIDLRVQTRHFII